MFQVSSCICFLFHISYINTYLLSHTIPSNASSPPLLIHKGPLFFWPSAVSSPQSFHSSTQQWKLAAYCKSAYTSSRSCCIVLCSCYRHKPFVQHCSFCQLIRFLVAFGDKLLKVRQILLIFLRCALTCSTSTTILLAAKRCNSSQILIHKSASPALGLMHYVSPLLSPSIIPFLSTCTLIGPITFLRRH